MSQRGDGAYHAYRDLSRSPPGDDQVSPTNTTHRLPPDNPSKYTTATLRGNQPHVPSPSKALGVHSILNPPGAESSLYREQPLPGPALRDGDVSIPGGYGAQHYAHRTPFYGSHPGTPVIGHQSSEQQSPSSSQALPALNNPRKILSPKPPRAASLSRGSGGLEYDARRPSFPTTPSFAKRRYESEASEDGRRQLPGLPPQPAMPTMPPTSRSMSQPLSRPPSIPQSQPHGSPPQREHMPHSMLPAQPQYLQSAHAHRSFTMAGPPSESGNTWKDSMHRASSGLTSSLMAGEEAFMTLPGTDIHIPVQVDYSQASKKADEKRQRNAKASTRHRRKKKNLQEENIRQLQELKDEHQGMANEVEILRQQRDFYREERNRLRELVLRTPSISEQAVGPPTPTSVRSIESFADRSPIGPPSQLATPSQGYASEASSTAEPPRQRRRTEDRSEFSIPVYGTPTGGPSASLPSVHGHPYGVPPRPPSVSSVASVERLPPLRTMEGPSVVGGAHEQDPRTGQWVPVQSRPFETGWATGQRHPGEGPPRQ